MARRRRDPVDEFLTQVGEDIADALDGLVVAGIAALAGAGVAKVAPTVKTVVFDSLSQVGQHILEQAAADPGPRSRKQPAAKPRKALPGPRKRARTVPAAAGGAASGAGEVIDLHKGADGVYR